MTTVEEFRKFGKEMVDYIADYLTNVRDHDAVSKVEPGYLRKLMPGEAPEDPEHYKEIFKDIDRLVIPGLTNWNHPNFHGFFSIGAGLPGIVGEMLNSAIACNGFSWASSPVYTELEMQMMDWLAKIIDLPDHFLFSHEGPGGGVIQGFASEVVLIALLMARTKYHKKTGDNANNFEKLVAYSSEYSHSSIAKAGVLGGMRMRLLPSDKDYSLRGDTLRNAIKEDRKAGLIPCFCVATLGTTVSCAFDNLDEIGQVCEEEDLFLHVDSAYAGAAFACEEYRYLMKGLERADSFCFNMHKLMLVQAGSSCHWVKDSTLLTDAFNVDRLYLSLGQKQKTVDYRHWQIPLGKRFRSLKVWFTLRLYGRLGIQKYIRDHIAIAKEFERLVRTDSRLEIAAPVVLGLVCFRYNGSNEENELLFNRISDEGKVFLVPATLDGKYIIRFATGHGNEMQDAHFAFSVVQDHLNRCLTKNGLTNGHA